MNEKFHNAAQKMLIKPHDIAFCFSFGNHMTGGLMQNRKIARLLFAD